MAERRLALGRSTVCRLRRLARGVKATRSSVEPRIHSGSCMSARWWHSMSGSDGAGVECDLASLLASAAPMQKAARHRNRGAVGCGRLRAVGLGDCSVSGCPPEGLRRPARPLAPSRRRSHVSLDTGGECTVPSSAALSTPLRTSDGQAHALSWAVLRKGPVAVPDLFHVVSNPAMPQHGGGAAARDG